MTKRIISLFLAIVLIVLSGCVATTKINSVKEKNEAPKVDREFRGAWIATVANINWPSTKNLSTEEQKQEAISILDKLKSNNFNAVIFQARPQCDALYKSEIEPWSYYLTGQQGKAPQPFYDPLEFWVSEAHKRGMELHVWLNPYRAHHIEGGGITEFSIVKTRPEIVAKLKSGYWWLDPSKKEAQDYSFSVVMDITKRYDIDAIHFDDYFYPYPSYNDNEDFPDEESWKKYLAGGGQLSRADWRRENINHFIKRIYDGIREVKPNVKFGLSPFGIWRPRNPESIEGFDQYDQIFADAKLWLNEGWIDYWTPQLYWKISNIQQSFPVLINWWKNENIKGKHFWPGLNIERDNNELNNIEVVNQIMTVRGMLSESPGNIFWSAGPVLKYPELSSALTSGPYKRQALIPTTPWLKSEPIDTPDILVNRINDNLKITWKHKHIDQVFSWIVYYKLGNRWEYKILTKDKSNLELPVVVELKSFNGDGAESVRNYEITEIAVSAVNRSSEESIPAFSKINPR